HDPRHQHEQEQRFGPLGGGRRADDTTLAATIRASQLDGATIGAVRGRRVFGTEVDRVAEAVTIGVGVARCASRATDEAVLHLTGVGAAVTGIGVAVVAGLGRLDHTVAAHRHGDLVGACGRAAVAAVGVAVVALLAGIHA